MAWFILLLATVETINNLLTNHMQKWRATAMYKSVGLSNRQRMRMTLVGGFSSGLIGAATAILVPYMRIQTVFLVVGSKIAMTPELSVAASLMTGVMGIVVALGSSVTSILEGRKVKLVEKTKFE